MTPEQLFLDNLSLIKEVAAHTCRRCNLKKEKAEEFLSKVEDKIMADDYAVLRKFEGKCSLKGYLTVVIKNQMCDFQDHLWGKWHPSEMAKRLGQVAMDLEKFLRDGYTFDETVAILQMNYKVKMSRQELYGIAEKLPPRTPRDREGGEPSEAVPSTGDSPDAGILAQEKIALKVKALKALQTALLGLPAEDQVILRMLLWSRFTVVQIAKALKLEQRPLYKRIQRIKDHLRRKMEFQGVRKEDVDDLFNE